MQALRRKPVDPLLGRLPDLEHVDEAVRQVERDSVTARLDTAPTGFVEDTP